MGKGSNIVKFKVAKDNVKKKSDPPKMKLTRRNMAIVAMSLIILWSVVSMVMSQVKMWEIRSEGNSYRVEIDQLKNEIETLEKEKSESQSLDYVEKVAREKLKMVMPDEVIYFIKDKKSETGDKTE
jgi:cell division protein DivIC